MKIRVFRDRGWIWVDYEPPILGMPPSLIIGALGGCSIMEAVNGNVYFLIGTLPMIFWLAYWIITAVKLIKMHAPW